MKFFSQMFCHYFLAVHSLHNNIRRGAFLNYSLINVCKAHTAASFVLNLIKWFPQWSSYNKFRFRQELQKSLLPISWSWADHSERRLHSYSHNREVYLDTQLHTFRRYYSTGPMPQSKLKTQPYVTKITARGLKTTITTTMIHHVYKYTVYFTHLVCYHSRGLCVLAPVFQYLRLRYWILSETFFFERHQP